MKARCRKMKGELEKCLLLLLGQSYSDVIIN